MRACQIKSLPARILAFSLLFLLIAPTGMSKTFAVPSIAEIENDIKEFQHYFKRRFADVALDEYTNGVNALPQNSERKASWEWLMALPPYAVAMETARQQWREPFANGASFEQCFSEHPVAHKFPYFKNGQVFTIVGAINQCLLQHNEAVMELDSSKMARLVATFKEQSNGERINIDYSDVGMREVYAIGRQYYWARRGQHNFSCASCHVNNAGNRLRGDVLSAGLGQTSGFPVYRIKWAISSNGDNAWGTIHRRYASCNIQAGATPSAAQSRQYIALEVYQAIMNSGIPLKVPSLRQ